MEALSDGRSLPGSDKPLSTPAYPYDSVNEAFTNFDKSVYFYPPKASIVEKT